MILAPLLVLVAALPDTVGVEPFSVDARTLRASFRSGVYVAEGDAVLRRSGTVVHADRLTLDENNQTVTAEGHVVVVEGAMVLVCDRVSLRVPELRGGVASAELRIKSSLAASTLAGLPAKEAIRHGSDELVISAELVERTSDRTYDVTGGDFTPCDCPDDCAPSWKVRAQSASLDLDSGVWLSWPVMYVKDVPVFALPAMYLPLGQRRTGLLLPRMSGAPPTGFVLSQPLFIALGRSWDATLDATYFFARGPAPSLELRWAPSTRSRGWMSGTYFADFGTQDPVEGTWSVSRSTPISRFHIDAHHETRLGSGAVVVHLDLAGDPAYQADLAERLLERQIEVSTSQATYTYQTEGLRLATGLALRQDLRPGRYPSGELRQVRLFSDAPGPGDVRYRFAELRVDAPPYPLADGWLLGEARLHVDTFAAPFPEQPRFARADLRPSLTAPLNLAGWATLEPSAALRLTGWSGRADGASISEGRIAVIGHSRLFTEVSRRYGRHVHVIRPEVRHAIVPYLRGGPGRLDTDDEIDQLGAIHQVSARLSTTLLQGARRVAHLSATFGRDLGWADVPSEGWSPVVLEGDASVPLGGGFVAGLSATAALETRGRTLSELLLQARLRAGRWGSAFATWGDLASDVPRRTFVAPEELVPSATMDRSGYGLGVPGFAATDFRAALASGELDRVPWTAFRGLVAGLTFRPLEPLTATFNVTVDVLRGPDVPAIRTVGGSIRWDSPCRCWSGVVRIKKDRNRGPDFSLNVDLARLGQVVSG